MSVSADNAARIKRDMARTIRDRTAFDEMLAIAIAEQVYTHLLDDMQGQRLYFTRSTQERDAAVRRDFDGTNHQAVMDKHDISRATLYRILNRRNGPAHNRGDQS